MARGEFSRLMTIAAVLSVIGVAGCGVHAPALPMSTPAEQLPPQESNRGVSESGLLRDLTVAPEDATAPYDRDDWPHWSTDHGWPYDPTCDTRDLVLLETGGKHPDHGSGADPQTCTVSAGQWLSLYDTRRVHDPHELEIDHVVPLAEAARSGAHGWDEAKRERFANDRAGLLAVTSETNRDKSDGDPAQWRPPVETYWCEYARMYADVKIRYGLTVDSDEQVALGDMLATCPDWRPQT